MEPYASAMRTAIPIACTTADGWTLRGDLLPAPSSDIVVVLAHAMMTSRRSMDRPRGSGLASTLVARGMSVLSFDLRGHGESTPTAREGGRYAYEDFVRFDMPAIFAAARDRFPSAFVAHVGHSLGAHTALIATALFPEHAPNAIVGLAANMWLPHLDPSPARRACKRLLLETWRLVAIASGGAFDPSRFGVRADAEPLPYIEEFVAMYARDRFANRTASLDYAALMGETRVPYFAITSEGDRLLAHPEAVARFNRMAKRNRLKERCFTHRELGGRAPGHMEIVTASSSRPIWEAAADWILEERTLASARDQNSI
jgi:predicted alpha/beta hydrolase